MNLNEAKAMKEKTFLQIYVIVLKRSILVVLGIMLTLFYLEFATRVFGPAEILLNETDPAFGTKHTANFSARVWNPESGRSNYVETNARGNIGTDISNPLLASSTKKIAILGDSIAEGLQVDSSNISSRLLEKKLNSTHCVKNTYAVENFGISGSDNFYEYLTYRESIRPYRPDHVFIFVNISDDVDQNIAYLGYNLETFRHEQTLFPGKTILLKSRFFRLLDAHLWGLDKIKQLARRIGFSFGKTTDNPQQSDTERAKYTAEILTHFSNDVHNNGGTFSPVLILAGYDSKSDLDRGESILENIESDLKKNKVSYIDSRSLFNKTSRGEQLRVNGHNHLTIAGNAAMSELLFNSLVDAKSNCK